MKNKFSKTYIAASMCTVIAGSSGMANASVSVDESPFSMSELNGGYIQLAEGKCGEGKCGGSKDKKEGKCGEGKCGGSKGKKEGKCGEGKCGGSKGKKEGKCGEGKCGEKK